MLDTDSLANLILSYPLALGATVSPLSDLIANLPPLSSKAVHPKTRFSMVIPGVTDEWLKQAGDIKHVVIFGIGEYPFGRGFVLAHAAMLIRSLATIIRVPRLRSTNHA